MHKTRKEVYALKQMNAFLVSTLVDLTVQPSATQKEVKNEVRLMRNLRH